MSDMNWPVTIALPEGLTIGGITTWAVRLSIARAAADLPTNLIVHTPEARHATISVEGLRHPLIRQVPAPSLRHPDFPALAAPIYRELLPTVLLPNQRAELYEVAAGLSLAFADQLRVLGWCHSDNPYDYQFLTHYEPVIADFVAVSRQCEQELHARLPHRRADTHYLPYGVPVPDARARRAPVGRPIRLLYAGRMDQGIKRVFDYLSLADWLDGFERPFELRLVGDGPEYEVLAERVAQRMERFAHRGNRMSLEAAVPPEQVSTLWEWADVALLTSSREGFSVSMVEAMMHGCVPVMSRVASGVSELVRDGETGFTFTVGDVPALARLIVRLVDDPDGYDRLSAAAREAAIRVCRYDEYFGSVQERVTASITKRGRRWPSDRPLGLRAAGAGDSGQRSAVPADAEERVRAQLRELMDAGISSIAVYGGGAHTRGIAEVLADYSELIVAVLDDDHGRIGRTLWGWPVLAPERVVETTAQAILISSWQYEGELAERHAAFFAGHGLPVFRLYAAPELKVAAG